MKVYFKIFGNWAYPRLKFKVCKCWGYDLKQNRERKGICFTIFRKIYIIGISVKSKPLNEGPILSNTRVMWSKTKNNLGDETTKD